MVSDSQCDGARVTASIGVRVSVSERVSVNERVSVGRWESVSHCAGAGQ